MQVILTKDVDTLGAGGDVVQVSDGFARNYLLPQKLAVVASDGALKDLKGRITRIQAKAEKKHQDDLAKAAKVTALGTISLEANSGEGGKLYGTITTKELAKVLQEKTGLDIERRNLNLDHPIHKVGEYTLNVKFSPKVSAQVKIDVKGSKAEKEQFVLADAFSEEE